MSPPHSSGSEGGCTSSRRPSSEYLQSFRASKESPSHLVIVRLRPWAWPRHVQEIVIDKPVQGELLSPGEVGEERLQPSNIEPNIVINLKTLKVSLNVSFLSPLTMWEILWLSERFFAHIIMKQLFTEILPFIKPTL